MALLRVFSRVDEGGRIPLPANIRRVLDLKPGELVEVKVVGAGKKQLLVTKRKVAR